MVLVSSGAHPTDRQDKVGNISPYSYKGLDTKIGWSVKPFLVLHCPHTCTHTHNTDATFSVDSGSTPVSETILATQRFPFSKWKDKPHCTPVSDCGLGCGH